MAGTDRSVAPSTIVVTGGTGCVGAALLRQLTARPQDRVVSLSRGVSTSATLIAGVQYRQVDIRCADEVGRAFAELRPDAVYHLAAVRDPALAEVEVQRTIATNVGGTVHVLDAARTVGVRTFVYASTGKAVRLYTGDVYAATKKIGEGLVANSGLPVASFVRFTHIVDNSLIMQKLRDGVDGKPIRLHAEGIGFHVQSAFEAAQLLNFASRRSALYTMRDLDWPIDLLTLTLDVLRELGRRTPIYFCGYEQGYEAEPYPGLYDPRSCGETGPLINALESYSAAAALHGQLNEVPLVRVGDAVGGASGAAHAAGVAALLELTALWQGGASPALLRAALRSASLAGLRALLERTSTPELARMSYLGRRYNAENPDHLLVHRAVDAVLDGRSGHRETVLAS